MNRNSSRTGTNEDNSNILSQLLAIFMSMSLSVLMLRFQVRLNVSLSFNCFELIINLIDFIINLFSFIFICLPIFNLKLNLLIASAHYHQYLISTISF